MRFNVIVSFLSFVPKGTAFGYFSLSSLVVVQIDYDHVTTFPIQNGRGVGPNLESMKFIQRNFQVCINCACTF